LFSSHPIELFYTCTRMQTRTLQQRTEVGACSTTPNASQSSTFATEPTIPLACKADTASAGKKQGVTGTGARGIPGMPNISARVSGLLFSSHPIELFFDSAFKLPEVRGKQCTGE
jgi:hypothetical protein